MGLILHGELKSLRVYVILRSDYNLKLMNALALI